MEQHVNESLPKERENRNIEIDLVELFYFYGTKLKYLIGAFVAGALVAGLITAFLITPKYTANATMYMISSSNGSVLDLTQLDIGKSLSSDYVELMKTRPIINGVKKDLHLDYTYQELSNMISLTVKEDTRIIEIAVTSTSRTEARDIANALARRTEVHLPKVMDAPKPNIAEEAITPTVKSSPSLTKNTMIGALVLLLVALVIFTVQYLRDDTLKSGEDIEKYFGVLVNQDRKSVV